MGVQGNVKGREKGRGGEGREGKGDMTCRELERCGTHGMQKVDAN